VDNSHMEKLLDMTLEEFRMMSEEPESGLDVDDSALLQLRKSWRLLKAIDALKKDNGYYTLIIEASFAAIERTIQFYLLDKRYIKSGDFVDHESIYQGGESVGLYGVDFKEKLLELWKNNRSRTYYREGIGTAKSADLISEMAEEIHEHVLQLAGESHECICE